MGTRKEERATKKAIHRARREAQEAPGKQAVAAHKKAAKAARVRRAEKLQKSREDCKARKERVKLEADEQFKNEVKESREKRKAIKKAARTQCATDAEAIKAAAAKEIEEAKKKEREERAFQRKIKRDERRGAQRRNSRASAQERRSESDDEVLANLSVTPEYIPLWRRIKRTIRGSAYMSRTDQFLHYVHEHPDEVYAAQEAEVEREIRAYYEQEARFHAERVAMQGEEPEGGLLDELVAGLDDLAA